MSDVNKPGSGRADPSAPAVDKPASNIVVLPPEAIREAAEKGTGLQVTISTAYSGPLPPPAVMREFNEIVPGLPNILIDEFQRESRHRRFTQKGGMLGALVIAALSIIGGVYLGYALKSPLAAFAVIGPVCGVVGTAQLLEFWFKAK